MVGIDNTSARYEEYRGPACRFAQDEPERLSRRPPAAGDDRAFTNYATFLIHELRPQIERTYRVRRDAAQTGLLGSSLGGSCSLALAWDHPEVFGLAASLSGAFQVERTNFLGNVLRAYRGPAKPVRLYLDSGTTDFTGDDDGRRNTEAVAAELRRIGWKDGATLMHFVDERPLTEEALAKTGLRQDKWKEALFSQHNEFYWRQRVWRALVFLFPP